MKLQSVIFNNWHQISTPPLCGGIQGTFRWGGDPGAELEGVHIPSDL